MQPGAAWDCITRLPTRNLGAWVARRSDSPRSRSDVPAEAFRSRLARRSHRERDREHLAAAARGTPFRLAARCLAWLGARAREYVPVAAPNAESSSGRRPNGLVALGTRPSGAVPAVNARLAVIAAAAAAIVIAVIVSAGGGDDGTSTSTSGAGQAQHAPAGAVTITFPYSPEKEPLLKPVIARFNASGALVNGQKVFVDGQSQS